MKELYKITNKINGKCYIGQTYDIRKRIFDHKKPSTKSQLNFAFKKYGFNNFEVEVLAECSVGLIDSLEEKAIAYFNSVSPNGYNVESGGSVFKAIHAETKKKIGAKSKAAFAALSDEEKKERKRKKGEYRATEETKRKLSLAGMGRFVSEKTRQKKSLAMKGRIISIEARWKMSETKKAKNWHPSEEGRKRMSEAARKNKISKHVPITEKLCPCCGVIKPVSDFFNRKTKSGIPAYKLYCRKCHGQKGMERKRKAKAEKEALCLSF